MVSGSGSSALLGGTSNNKKSIAEPSKFNKQRQVGADDDCVDVDAWPIEAIEEGMRWGVSLASAAVMIRGASVPPDRSEIQKFFAQAKQPEYPPSSTKTAVVSDKASVVT